MVFAPLHQHHTCNLVHHKLILAFIIPATTIDRNIDEKKQEKEISLLITPPSLSSLQQQPHAATLRRTNHHRHRRAPPSTIWSWKTSLSASHSLPFSFRKITCMDAGGLDSNGREYKSADEMWKEQAGDPNKKTHWYRDGVSYWEGVKATVDGVLGGYPNVSEPDISCSDDFLKILLSERFPSDVTRQPLVALDCGSGIGRVTKNLLIRYFNEVDLLEPVSHFLEAAREMLVPGGGHTNSDTHKAVNFYCMPLQDFTPETGRYDVIWIQWCIGHLTDDDFITFFKRAKVGLKPGGLFVLKENIARSGFVLDNEDRSITRSDSYFRELFSRCGLHIYKLKDQKGFPEELFAVKMYALTTEAPKKIPRTRSKAQANRPRTIV